MKHICRSFLKEQFTKKSGYAANKDRKNLAAAWDWGKDNIDGWPRAINPLRQIKKYPEMRSERYVPPESDFWEIFKLTEGDSAEKVQDRAMLLAYLHLAGRRSEIFR